MRSPWINQTTIKSASSSREYTVSEWAPNGMPTGTWGCNCPGWKAYGKCKHLRTMGLTSSRTSTMPAPKGYGNSDNSTFTDDAYNHYDTRTGFGTPDEWFRIAEEAIRGRSHYKPRTRYTRTHSKADDMLLLGLDEMPEDAKGLLRAMRKMAMKTHPDHGGSNEAFREMYAAYERLARMY